LLMASMLIASCMVKLLQKGLSAGSSGPEGLRLKPPLGRLAAVVLVIRHLHD
jgi:hypothetical protein